MWLSRMLQLIVVGEISTEIYSSQISLLLERIYKRTGVINKMLYNMLEVIFGGHNAIIYKSFCCCCFGGVQIVNLLLLISPIG